MAARTTARHARPDLFAGQGQGLRHSPWLLRGGFPGHGVVSRAAAVRPRGRLCERPRMTVGGREVATRRKNVSSQENPQGFIRVCPYTSAVLRWFAFGLLARGGLHENR
jgi:hypothetical protein